MKNTREQVHQRSKRGQATLLVKGEAPTWEKGFLSSLEVKLAAQEEHQEYSLPSDTVQVT